MRQEPRIARWYRGLSDRQLAAVRGLQQSLITDAPHRSTKCVRQSLSQLGIYPLVEHAELLQIADLSRNQDIAFLYFLMLAHYTCKDGATCGADRKYSINEQQIMSAIAVLDLPLTLHALDQLLPPGVQRTTRTDNGIKQAKPKRAATQPVMEAPVLPYLLKQRRFKEQPNSQVSRPSNFQARFLDDEHMTSESVASAEASRWFADYQLQPGRRYVKSIISEELHKLFDDIDNGKPPQEKQVLCSYHQTTKNLKRHQYIVQARQRCLDTIDLSAKKKQQCKERILKQLERNVQHYLEQFGQRWNCHWSLVPTLPKRDCSVCCHLVGTTGVFPPKNQVLLMTNVGDADCHVSEAMCAHMKSSSKPIVLPHAKFRRLSAGEDRLAACTLADSPKQVPLGKRNSHVPSPPVRYLKATTQHTPYTIDYSQVFDIHSSKLDPEDTVKGYAVRALAESDVSLVTPSENMRIPFGNLAPMQRLNALNAVNKCVQNIWLKGLERQQYQTATQAEPCTVVREESRSGDKRHPHYDPNDDQLMDQMLRNAMHKLRKDPKYVLASLPQSHSLPVLREWIKKRYGKWYAHETLETFRKTTTRLANLTKLRYPPHPKLNQAFGKNTVKSSYNEHKRYKERAEHFKQAYQFKMKNDALQSTRRAWHALNIHRTYGEGLYNTFFAYMPATFHDIQPYFKLY